MSGRDDLEKISERLTNGLRPDQVTVRELLGWYGAQRRGYGIVSRIRSHLEAYNLETVPDFEWAHIGSRVSFVRTGEVSLPDPTYRIGQLDSANRDLISVTPDDTVELAITLMLEHDFSQLPVMRSIRDVKGSISWRSIASRLVVGERCEHVRDCMGPHREVDYDSSLLNVIDTIVADEYVLVRGRDKAVTGIVTTSDLGGQFRQLGEPFILIGEIENYVRRILHHKFSMEELADSKAPGDDERKIESVWDLTFGEYARLIEKPERWEKLGLRIDRKVFIDRLDAVRQIRNDVMHFSPDGIASSDLTTLQQFAKLLRKLATMGAI